MYFVNTSSALHSDMGSIASACKHLGLHSGGAAAVCDRQAAASCRFPSRLSSLPLPQRRTVSVQKELLALSPSPPRCPCCPEHSLLAAFCLLCCFRPSASLERAMRCPGCLSSRHSKPCNTALRSPRPCATSAASRDDKILGSRDPCVGKEG